MQMIFKRYEIKYLITYNQYQELEKIMKLHMILDNYGKHLINNIYFDTPDYKIIRKSLERPHYKEKLRVRSYNDDVSNLFIELKKKYNKVVYKRRINCSKDDVYSYLVENKGLNINNQIKKEIDYFKNFYVGLSPQVFISYEREAFYGIENSNFRITFDHNIKMRDYDIFNLGVHEGNSIIDDDKVLLEVKTVHGIPSWLLNFLSSNKIYKTSFSKYGISYQKLLKEKEKKQYVN